MRSRKQPLTKSGTVAQPLPLLLCLLLCLLLGACTSPRIERNLRDKPIGQSFTPKNIYAVELLPPGFNRVLVLPPTNPKGGDLSPELQDAMLVALRQVARFEVVFPGSGSGTVDASASLPRRLTELPLPAAIVQEAERRGVDGILQFRFTHYRPYKPMQIGLRARLVALRGEGQPEGGVLWEIDELFDAGHKAVAIGARRYAEARLEQAFPLQSSYSVLMSPVRFAGYVGHTAFETLPAPANR